MRTFGFGQFAQCSIFEHGHPGHAQREPEAVSAAMQSLLIPVGGRNDERITIASHAFVILYS